MQMLKKLFSSNKYYLELKEEIEDLEVVQTAIKTAEKTAEVVKEKAQDVAKSEPVQSAVKTAGEVAEAAQDKVASAIATDDKSNKSKKVKSTETAEDKAKGAKAVEDKAKSNGKAAPKATEKEGEKEGEKEAKPARTNSGASSDEPPFWVAAMNNTNKNKTNSNGQVAEQTFAPENLLPIATKYRRRPGGSLDKFKDMAKSAKTPRR